MRKLQLLEMKRNAAAAMALSEREEEADMEEQMAPKFTTRPKNLFQVAEGKNVHFEAKLEPITDPDLQVEWLKDGRPVTVGHRFRPIHDFGYVALDIKGVISEDSGTYTCRATNLMGSDEFSLQLQCAGEWLSSVVETEGWLHVSNFRLDRIS